MLLVRSEKAKTELASKERSLSLRERSALFLADGQRSMGQLEELLRDENGVIRNLVKHGYLVPPAPVPQDAHLVIASPANAPPVAAQLAPPAILSVTRVQAEPEPKPAASTFDGKRSLATTRMFLFDICERMFARKIPELAIRYRDQLREARSRELMMDIAEDMLITVEEIAGAERASGLRERIFMLLPAEE